MAAWSVGGIRKATTRRRAGPEQNSLARACPRRATRRDDGGGLFHCAAQQHVHGEKGGKRTPSRFFWEIRWAQKHKSREGLI